MSKQKMSRRTAARRGGENKPSLPRQRKAGIKKESRKPASRRTARSKPPSRRPGKNRERTEGVHEPRGLQRGGRKAEGLMTSPKKSIMSKAADRVSPDHVPRGRVPRDRVPLDHGRVGRRPANHKPLSRRPADRRPANRRSARHRAADRAPADRRAEGLMTSPKKSIMSKAADRVSPDHVPRDHVPLGRKALRRRGASHKTKALQKNSASKTEKVLKALKKAAGWISGKSSKKLFPPSKTHPFSKDRPEKRRKAMRTRGKTGFQKPERRAADSQTNQKNRGAASHRAAGRRTTSRRTTGRPGANRQSFAADDSKIAQTDAPFRAAARGGRITSSDPPKGALFQGMLKRHPGGFGFVIPKKGLSKDIYIPSAEMRQGLSHDLVEVEITGRAGGRLYGSITKVLDREREFVSGPVELLKGEPVLTRHGLGSGKPLSLTNPLQLKWADGDWVRAKLTPFEDFFKGEIQEILGAITSSAEDDSRRALALQNIPLGFSADILQAAEKISDAVSEKELQRRRDLRDKPFITVDGADAKDFDDSIFVEEAPDKGFRLYVAIADVSFYVTEGSLLDKAAFLRGNSAYLPLLTSPMLPENLSCHVCSLKPGVPRLALVAEMEFNPKGQILKSSFYEAVIESRKRLTYASAQDMLDSLKSLGELAFLKSAEKLARLLIKQSDSGGALDFNLPETVIKVNAKGEPLDIMRSHRLFSHRLIESFMLAANKAAALFLKQKTGALMYRIHEKPDKNKLQRLALFAQSPIRSRESLLQLIKKFKGKSREALIHKLILRAMAQACYSPRPLGHYGLNEAFYTHFTSPIRRYNDLLIHRALKKALHSPQAADKDGKKEAEKQLAEQGAWISAREQAAAKAERMAEDIKKARFLKPRLGETFEGAVSSVTSFGLFVSLKNYDIEGLIRFRDLPGRWIADEERMQADARESRYAICFGDAVTVQAAAADEIAGKADFKLLSHKGRPLPKERAYRERPFGRASRRAGRGLRRRF